MRKVQKQKIVSLTRFDTENSRDRKSRTDIRKLFYPSRDLRFRSFRYWLNWCDTSLEYNFLLFVFFRIFCSVFKTADGCTNKILKATLEQNRLRFVSFRFVLTRSYNAKYMGWAQRWKRVGSGLGSNGSLFCPGRVGSRVSTHFFLSGSGRVSGLENPKFFKLFCK